MPTVRRSSFIITLLGLVAVTPPSRAAVELESDLFQVTDSDALESTPSLGRDGLSDVVVYSSRPAAGGDADIQLTRIIDGLPAPRTITLPGLSSSGGESDDILNDIDGNRVVFSAFESAQSGSVVLYDLATSRQVVLASAPLLFEARIHGEHVIWNESDGEVGRVVLLHLGTGEQRTLAESSLVVSVDVDSRFAVYSVLGPDGFSSAFAYELSTGATTELPRAPETSNLVPRTSGDWVAWQERDLFGNDAIVAMNLATDDYREIASGGVFRPTLDGDILAYETTSTGNGVDVAIHRLSTEQSFALTTLPGDQFLTDVFESRVAFVDGSESRDDVYYANLSFGVPPPPFECPSEDAESVCGLACENLVLVASKRYHPSRWSDGEACLCEPTSFRLPSELAVLGGNSGNHWTDVLFEEGGEEIRCRYRGGSSQAHPSDPKQIAKGVRYVFDECTDGRQAGDVFTTQYIRVFLANGDSRPGITEVEARFAQPGCGDDAVDTAPASAVASWRETREAQGCAATPASMLSALVALAVRRRRRR